MKKFIFLAALLLSACSNTAPTVLSTMPANGAKDVDSTLTNLSVTFNEAMKDKSWSWAYTDANEFPTVTGDPVYSDQNTTNTLPVTLLPSHHYVIWLNSESNSGFTAENGSTLAPYKWEFWTK